MGKRVYIGVDNKARKVKKMYIGIDGVARKVKKAYIGVDGVAQLLYSSTFDFTVKFNNTSYVLHSFDGWTWNDLIENGYGQSEPLSNGVYLGAYLYDGRIVNNTIKFSLSNRGFYTISPLMVKISDTETYTVLPDDVIDPNLEYTETGSGIV